MGESAASPLRAWYGAEPFGSAWMKPAAASTHAAALADALERRAVAFGAGPATLANIAKLRAGARAVVTGQQVGLLGGPLLTLLKAATAIARAKQATAETGIEHVPIFWLATEDHDLEEVDQVSLLSKSCGRNAAPRSEAAPCRARGQHVLSTLHRRAARSGQRSAAPRAHLRSAARVLRVSARQSRPNLRQRLCPPDDAPLRRATASS